MLPPTNNVCLRWKQENVHFSRVFSRLCAANSPSQGIHDENVASIGPQKQTNRIKITEKWQQMKNQTARFRYGTIRKRPNTCRKTKFVSHKKKKSKNSCRTRPLSTINVCRWWKQETLCFKLEVLNLWPQDSPFDMIHVKNVASIGPQYLRNRIEMSQNASIGNSSSQTPISNDMEKTQYI